ncbi:MAG: hypothetical protein ACRYFU_25905 [Janthinobacterium lividum]
MVAVASATTNSEMGAELLAAKLVFGKACGEGVGSRAQGVDREGGYAGEACRG